MNLRRNFIKYSVDFGSYYDLKLAALHLSCQNSGQIFQFVDSCFVIVFEIKSQTSRAMRQDRNIVLSSNERNNLGG